MALYEEKRITIEGITYYDYLTNIRKIKDNDYQKINKYYIQQPQISYGKQRWDKTGKNTTIKLRKNKIKLTIISYDAQVRVRYPVRVRHFIKNKGTRTLTKFFKL